MLQKEEMTPGKAITITGISFFFMYLLALFCGILNNFDATNFHIVARNFVWLIATIVIGMILSRYERSNKAQATTKER